MLGQFEDACVCERAAKCDLSDELCERRLDVLQRFARALVSISVSPTTFRQPGHAVDWALDQAEIAMAVLDHTHKCI